MLSGLNGWLGDAGIGGVTSQRRLLLEIKFAGGATAGVEPETAIGGAIISIILPFFLLN
jgi:hypothetical protein